MKEKRQRGLTLIETVIAIGVMAVVLSAAYATVRDGLKLYDDLHTQSDRIVARCELAEQLTADFRGSRETRTLGPREWVFTQPDGSEILYRAERGRAIRFSPRRGQAKRLGVAFNIGPFDVAFSETGPAAVMRVKLADAQLVVRR